ncbi:unnamed protein product [Ambrosiozyma monospora]|uniref:1-phosphatidylinositol 4-kinase n=1 Tax=Ambrosiozyma monospora TaxID=43982 RepID=A0A9W6YV87_AMBMO|nr:unnamed protein product [Ambrosiozyma monospora]
MVTLKPPGNPLAKATSASQDDDKSQHYEELITKLKSPDCDLFTCLNYLQTHADNIGVQYYLCQHVERYPMSELRFFIPQFLQLLITVETESIALEEMMKQLCLQDVHFSLITFWHLQALLQELSMTPESIGFQTCKRMLNDLQYQLFDFSNSAQPTPQSHQIQHQHHSSTHSSNNSVASPNNRSSFTSKRRGHKDFRENVMPSVILATSLLAGVTVPKATMYVEPIVKVQGRQLKSLVFEVVKDVKKSLTENLTKKNTKNNALLGKPHDLTNGKNSIDGGVGPGGANFKRSRSMYSRTTPASPIGGPGSPTSSIPGKKSEDLNFDMIDSYVDLNMPNLSRPSLTSKKSLQLGNSTSGTHININSHINSSRAKNEVYCTSTPPSAQPSTDHVNNLVSSMPNLHVSTTAPIPSQSRNSEESITASINSGNSYASSIRNSFDYRDSVEFESIYGLDETNDLNSIHVEKRQNVVKSVPLSKQQEIKLLKSSYFKSETQFVIALQNISIRLSKVPKEARLSTLKAELSMLNNDLPCEVDIPQLLPKNKKGHLHRICKFCVNESAVLNSAERVPYLLLIEYLADDVDFDPETASNKLVLNKLETKGGANDDTFKLTDKKKYRFDLAGQPISSSSTNLAAGANAAALISSSTSVLATATTNSMSAALMMSSSSIRSPSSRGSSITPTQSPTQPHHSDIDDLDLGAVSVVKMTNKIQHKRMASSQLNFPPGSSTTASSGTPNNSTLAHDNESSFDYLQESINNDEADSELAEQLRIASIMLTQLESSTPTLPNSQATQIKAKLVESMQAMQDSFGSGNHAKLPKTTEGLAGERKLSNDLKVAGNSYLGEDWNAKKRRIRMESPYGHLENWDLCSVIAKTGDDLTQEAFACQLIQTMARIWYKDHVKVWVKRMRIMVTSSNTGLVETITDALSVHSIKKSLTQQMIQHDELPRGQIANLKDHFIRAFGQPSSGRYKRAQENFCISCAAYCVISYILQIKDRHNGNIMLDSEGHMIHIDFGFLLSNSPGSVGFEAAPFKFPQEYLDILGGPNSYYFQKFKNLMKSAFKSIRSNCEPLISMVELMQRDSQLPCFKAGENTSVMMKQRLQLHLTDDEVDLFIENVLINKSIGSMYTRLYDQFQLITQGIYM